MLLLCFLYLHSLTKQQAPFQYSLHWIEQEGGELKHEDFLGDQLAQLARNLPICYNLVVIYISLLVVTVVTVGRCAWCGRWDNSKP